MLRASRARIFPATASFFAGSLTFFLALGGAEIEVYDDGTAIGSTLLPVSLPAGKGGGALLVSVRAQACNDTGRCLIPSTLTIDLPVRYSSGKNPPLRGPDAERTPGRP